MIFFLFCYLFIFLTTDFIFRYLATGESFHSLQFQFRISVSEISKIIKHTLALLKKTLVPLMLPPLTHEDLKKKQGNLRRNGIFRTVQEPLTANIFELCAQKIRHLFFITIKDFSQ